MNKHCIKLSPGYTNYGTQVDYGNHHETSVATNPSAPPSDTNAPPSEAPPAYYAAPGTAPQQYQPPGGNFNTSYQSPPPQHMTTSAPCTMYAGEQQTNYSVSVLRVLLLYYSSAMFQIIIGTLEDRHIHL